MAVTDNYVSYAGLTPEQVTYIDTAIKKYVQDDEGFWGQFFDKQTYVKGHKNFEHRKHIRPEVTKKFVSAMKLSEGIGAPSTDLKVVKWSTTFEDLGTYIPYTKEALRDSIDDVLDLAITQFKTYSKEVPELIRADVMATSNFQLSAETTVLDTLDKALVVCGKRKLKPYKDGKYMAVMTYELVAKLKKELRASNGNLDEVTKQEITRDGNVIVTDSFYVVPRSDEPMYTYESGTTTINGDKLIVIGKTRDNENAGIEMASEISIFDNGLGSGLIQKSESDTTLGADTNKREGTVAINIDHCGIDTQDDSAHIVCVFAHTEYAFSKTGSTRGDAVVTSASAPSTADNKNTFAE